MCMGVLCACISVHQVQYLCRLEENIAFLRTAVTDGCELQEFWESDPHHLEEQSMPHLSRLKPLVKNMYKYLYIIPDLNMLYDKMK